MGMEIDPRGDSPYKDLRQTDPDLALMQRFWDRAIEPETKVEPSFPEVWQLYQDRKITLEEAGRLSGLGAADPNLEMGAYLINERAMGRLIRLEVTEKADTTPGSSPSTPGRTSLSTLMSWVPSSFSMSSDLSDQAPGPESSSGSPSTTTGSC